MRRWRRAARAATPSPRWRFRLTHPGPPRSGGMSGTYRSGTIGHVGESRDDRRDTRAPPSSERSRSEERPGPPRSRCLVIRVRRYCGTGAEARKNRVDGGMDPCAARLDPGDGFVGATGPGGDVAEAVGTGVELELCADDERHGILPRAPPEPGRCSPRGAWRGRSHGRGSSPAGLASCRAGPGCGAGRRRSRRSSHRAGRRPRPGSRETGRPR